MTDMLCPAQCNMNHSDTPHHRPPKRFGVVYHANAQRGAARHRNMHLRCQTRYISLVLLDVPSQVKAKKKKKKNLICTTYNEPVNLISLTS